MPSRLPSVVYEPVGRCIYCLSEGSRSAPLGKEHIIPYGLGGDWILPRASCKECATITSSIELQCQRAMFGTLRVRLPLPTRRPEGHPTRLPIEFFRPDGKRERRIVPADQAPVAFLGFQLLRPGLLLDVPPSADAEVKLVAMVAQDDALTRIRQEPGSFKVGTITPRSFARLLAKIAHSYIVANFGLHSFRPFLPDLILGRSHDSPFQWVGADPHAAPPQQDLHHVYRQDCMKAGNQYILAAIRLFAFSGLPRYHVVVGEPHGWIRR
jgi:hypothetical protein